MSAPECQRLSPTVSVAPQLDVEGIAWAARAGFRSVVNNRPDFEGGPDQPTSAVLQAAAEAAGMRYVHLPVAPAVQTPAEIARFGELLAELPPPVLAFCRTGTRSGKLFRGATGG